MAHVSYGITLPSARQHLSYVIVWMLRGNIIRTALCWIVWHNIHSMQDIYVSSSYRSNRLGLSHWDPYAVHRCGCLELYYCNMVECFWCDSSLISTTSWFPSVLWHCWFGHLACKIVPEMTDYVSSGTLNPTHLQAMISHSFTCHPHTNHTCLCSSAAKHHRPLAGSHCAYPRRDGQAELTCVAGYILRYVSGTGSWSPDRSPIPVLTIGLSTADVGRNSCERWCRRVLSTVVNRASHTEVTNSAQWNDISPVNITRTCPISCSCC